MDARWLVGARAASLNRPVAAEVGAGQATVAVRNALPVATVVASLAAPLEWDRAFDLQGELLHGGWGDCHGIA